MSSNLTVSALAFAPKLIRFCLLLFARLRHGGAFFLLSLTTTLRRNTFNTRIMSSKRVLDKRQPLYIESWRGNLLAWLNKDRPAHHYSQSACKRIERLVHALQSLVYLLPRVETLRRGSITIGEIDEIAEIPKEAFKSIDIVSRLIPRYPSCPHFGWDQDGCLSFGRDFSRLRPPQAEEAVAADATLRLAEVSELTQLQQCLCGRWFFVSRKTQRSCSPTCRHKLYEQTDKFKANRRKYMNQYYRLKYSGKVK